MSGSRIRAELRVTGVVQGVGFRPFVYRTAVEHGLAGSVKNTGDAGVEIVLEGASDEVEAFLHDLETDAPPLSVVESVDVDRTTPSGLEAFEIVQSTDSSGGSGTIPPDTGMCDNCLEDVRDPDSRYHDYWATSCVDCGPRFTVIRELPYDRPTTSMDAFPMCPDCREEYTDPGDRRYHAQTIACPDCGPALSFLDADGSTRAGGTDALRATAARLRNGDVVAIKGIGGTHVACDATAPDVVNDLRERTGRPAKPFALMVPSLEHAAQFAEISPAEQSALTDTRRPIVLLDVADRPRDADWLDAVSPGLHTVGVMLPYSGLHHLLFDHVDRPLVMTSGNLPGQPMALTREAILDQLGDVVDASLVHDREIVARCDDSVVRYVDGERHFVRRSRGWVPVGLPRPVPDDGTVPEVLAVGAEFDATAAVTQGRDVIPTQHVGDVDDPDTVAYHREAISHLQALTGADPELVACDRHPDFLTTREAERYAEAGAEGPVRVQHHHAHAASLLGEHGVDRAIVVTADGTGYGPDGTIWGGEVLDATLATYERVGGLDRFSLPGGEAAIQHPARILADLLDDTERVTSLLVDTGTVDSAADARTVRRQASRGVNSPQTTSAGRFLDAVSAMLGAGPRRHYEGEPAMKLEALAARGSPLDLAVPYASRDGTRVVDVRELAARLDELARDHPAADVAATAQVALATGLAELAVESARERGVSAVGFSGGVAYNDAISRAVREVVEAADLTFLPHRDVPPGDAGIAYGQALVATARSLD